MEYFKLRKIYPLHSCVLWKFFLWPCEPAGLGACKCWIVTVTVIIVLGKSSFAPFMLIKGNEHSAEGLWALSLSVSLPQELLTFTFSTVPSTQGSYGVIIGVSTECLWCKGGPFPRWSFLSMLMILRLILNNLKVNEESLMWAIGQLISALIPTIFSWIWAGGPDSGTVLVLCLGVTVVNVYPSIPMFKGHSHQIISEGMGG